MLRHHITMSILWFCLFLIFVIGIQDLAWLANENTHNQSISRDFIDFSTMDVSYTLHGGIGESEAEEWLAQCGLLAMSLQDHNKRSHDNKQVYNKRKNKNNESKRTIRAKLASARATQANASAGTLE